VSGLVALASIGIKPEDVDYVLITPLQAYATANIHLFKNAQICLSKRGWIEDFHAEKFPMHVPREFRIPYEPLHYMMFEGNEKLRLLEDEDEIMPGLRAFWAECITALRCVMSSTPRLAASQFLIAFSSMRTSSRCCHSESRRAWKSLERPAQDQA
jgi:hypothetical protein